MLDWQGTLNPKGKLDGKVRVRSNCINPTHLPTYLPTCRKTYLPVGRPTYPPTYLPTYLPTTYLPTLNPKGKLDAKVRVRSDGRNPFALQAVWMKAGENEQVLLLPIIISSIVMIIWS